MRSILLAVAGFVVGTIAGVVLVFAAYILFIVVTQYNDFEGATSMGIATFVAPVGALVGGVVGAVMMLRRVNRPPEPPVPSFARQLDEPPGEA